MKKTIYFIILITLFCTGTVSAQLYQYVDENGNVNFTDDLGQVPQDQREQYLQPEEEPHTDNPATDESDSAGDGSTAVEDTPEETTATSNWPDSITAKETPDESIDEMFTRLNSTREELKTEYETIQKAKEELAATKEGATTPETVNAYNQKAKAINEQSIKFKEKNTAFQADQAAYNKRVQEELDAQSEKAEKESAESEKTQEPAENTENQQ